MAYLLPDNITGITGLLTYANMVTNYWFVNLSLAAIWFVAFISLKRYTLERAFLGSSVICAILSVLLLALNLITEWLMILFIVMTIAAILVTQYKTHEEI